MAVTGDAAVFLDKDGTLVDDVPYNVDVQRMSLVAGAGTALRALAGAGYRLIVISNQSGVARGYFAEDALQPVEDRLRTMLADEGVTLAGFYYCPHLPDGIVPAYARNCSCRKPQPGLIRAAAAAHGLDLTRSWVVGDILDDVEAGRRAGCTTVLIDNGNETEWALSDERVPHYVVASIVEASAAITAASHLRAGTGAGP